MYADSGEGGDPAHFDQFKLGHDRVYSMACRSGGRCNAQHGTRHGALCRAVGRGAHRANHMSRRLVMAVPMPMIVQAWMIAANRCPSAAAQPKMTSHTTFAACAVGRDHILGLGLSLGLGRFVLWIQRAFAHDHKRPI